MYMYVSIFIINTVEILIFFTQSVENKLNFRHFCLPQLKTVKHLQVNPGGPTVYVPVCNTRIKQHRSYTYNVTLRRIRVTIFAVEKQTVFHILLSVCVCVCVCVRARARM